MRCLLFAAGDGFDVSSRRVTAAAGGGGDVALVVIVSDGVVVAVAVVATTAGQNKVYTLHGFVDRQEQLKLAGWLTD